MLSNVIPFDATLTFPRGRRLTDAELHRIARHLNRCPLQSNVEHHAEMLLDFCEHYHIRPKAIVGHSMGGMLALKLAAEHRIKCA